MRLTSCSINADRPQTVPDGGAGVCHAGVPPHARSARRTPDLVNHACLMLPGFSRSAWKFTDASGHTSEIAVRERLRTSNAMALKQCALAHMGITLLARWMVGRELRAGTLLDVFADYAVTAAFDDAAAWLLYPSRTYVPLKVRVFVEWIRAAFKHGPPWDQPTQSEQRGSAT